MHSQNGHHALGITTDMVARHRVALMQKMRNNHLKLPMSPQAWLGLHADLRKMLRDDWVRLCTYQWYSVKDKLESELVDTTPFRYSDVAKEYPTWVRMEAGFRISFHACCDDATEDNDDDMTARTVGCIGVSVVRKLRGMHPLDPRFQLRFLSALIAVKEENIGADTMTAVLMDRIRFSFDTANKYVSPVEKQWKHVLEEGYSNGLTVIECQKQTWNVMGMPLLPRM